MESAQNRGYFTPQGWLPTLGCGWRATGPPGGAHGWLKSAAGRATGSDLRTRKSLIRLDFIEHKSERSVMPQDTGGWPERRSGRFGLRQLAAGLGADLWGSSAKLALAYLHAPRSLARTPVPDPWRAFGRNPAGFRPQPGALWPLWRTRHQATPLPQVRFCRHPSRPRVEWPDLPGRGSRQRLSVRRQTYPSLTAITKRITGTHWSGPRFFGLTPKRKA